MAWWKYARVGQKVECIKDVDQKGFQIFAGQVFTIKGIWMPCDREKSWGWVPGIDIGLRQSDGSVLWAVVTIFRPIQDTTKAVEALKRIYLNTPEKVGEGV